MTHRIGSKRIVRAGMLAASTFLATVAIASPPALPFSDVTTSSTDPRDEDRADLCKLLKILGYPCPPEEPSDFTPYEQYYADIEQAWMTSDPNGFNPQERENLLGAALDAKNSQTPAPAGVDPIAHQNFILVLDEIIYEMGG